MYPIAIVTPVAPRDLEYLTVCQQSIASAIDYLADSRTLSSVFSKVYPIVVVDGEVTEEEAQGVRRAMRLAYKNMPLHTVEVVPQIYFLQGSHGPGIARNVAIADMEPDTVVFFLDADDLMYPWSLSERLMLFMLIEEEILAYGQNVLVFEHPEHGTMRHIRECPSSKQLLMLQKQQNCLIPGVVAMRAGVIQKAGGFEPHLVCGEDGNLFRRVLEAGVTPISRSVPVQQYRYRENSQSKLATSDPATAEFNEHAYHLGVDWDKHGPMGQNLDPQAAVRAQAFEDAMTNGSWGDALEALAPGAAILDKVEIFYGDTHGNDPGADPSDPD